MNVLIYNEFRHELDPNGRAHTNYPNGMHTAIAGFLQKEPDINVRTVTLDTVTEITAQVLPLKPHSGLLYPMELTTFLAILSIST